MSVLVCADLDRTLIYSAAALELGDPAPPLRCVEMYDGAPMSFLTERAAAELERLALVPTTTRTPEQYRRVALPGPAPEFAITANGGVLLVDGVIDGDWSAQVVAEVSASTAPADVRTQLTGDFVLRVRTAAELFVYAVVDRDALPTPWLVELRGWCAERGWSVSVQGRKLYCVPDGLRKSSAAAEVARRRGATSMIAAGDSLLDTDLLLAADAAIRPAHGELHDSGFTAAHVAVTRASGVLAGEEIAAWLQREAARPAAGLTMR